MSMINKLLDARPVSKEVISSGKFVGLKDSERDKIKKVTIVPAKLGQKGFGGILVEYKTPTYKVG